MINPNRINQNFRVAVTSLLLCAGLAACSRQVTSQPPGEIQQKCPRSDAGINAPTDTNHPEPIAEPVAEPLSCPTVIEVRKSVSDCNELLALAKQALADRKSADSAKNATLFNDQARTWEKKSHDWKVTNDRLLQGSSLLAGANGTGVYPEMPVALQDLAIAFDWLEKSINATSSDQLKLSSAYVRGAHQAIARATSVLNGRIKYNSRRALIKTPDDIKAAERDSKVSI